MDEVFTALYEPVCIYKVPISYIGTLCMSMVYSINLMVLTDALII